MEIKVGITKDGEKVIDFTKTRTNAQKTAAKDLIEYTEYLEKKIRMNWKNQGIRRG